MKQPIKSEHLVDENGNPTGGETRAVGLYISWQNGPLGRGPDRLEPNGAFVESVIDAAIDRLEFYQRSKFACAENANAIRELRSALAFLEIRTKSRELRDVEGTHTP